MMKNHKTIIALAFCMLFTVFALSCGVYEDDEQTGTSLVSVHVTPPVTVMATFTTSQLAATGYYSDSTTEDFTSKVRWISSDETVATVDEYGNISAVGPGSVKITAFYGFYGQSANLTVFAATLTSLDISSPYSTIANTTSMNYSATGTFSDGTNLFTQNLTTQVAWNSSNPTVAVIDASGRATATGVGSTSITATFGSTVQSTALTVTHGALLSIFVAPVNPSIAKGLSQQFTATGVFEDGSSQNLTTQVAWSSSNTSVAVIDANGLAASNRNSSEGTTSIDATYSGVAASDSNGEATLTVTSAELLAIAVDPVSASIVNGTSQQFTAIGTYTDGPVDLTTQVTWYSSDPSVAWFDNNPGSTTRGLASSLTSGTAIINAVDPSTQIAATDSGGEATLNVIAVRLVSIDITPSVANTVSGMPGLSTQQFTAIGTYNNLSTQDITTNVIWSSSAPGVASINPNGGLATALATGTAFINAVDSTTLIAASDSGGQATMNVITLSSIRVTPSLANIPLGQDVQLAAIGTFSDLSELDITNSVTWLSSDDAVASISNTAGSEGLATGVNPGTAAIDAWVPSLGIYASDTGEDASVTVIPDIDLSVDIYNVDCNVNSQVTVFYSTTNSGTVDAGGFSVDVWDDLVSPPSVGDTGPGSLSSPGLAAGTSVYNSTSVSSALMSGIAYAVVDSPNVVAESDETNNVSTGFAWSNTYCSEGTSSSPIAVGAILPYTGTGAVGTSYSFYVISSLDPSTTYTLSLTGLSANADLYGFDDAAHSNLICISANGGTLDESCSISGVTDAYLVVYGTNTAGGATYTLSITP